MATWGETYTSHKLEDSALCELKQFHDFVQTFSHSIVIGICSYHTTVETVAKGMVDVELRRRSGCQK